jgi:hypothetical protein
MRLPKDEYWVLGLRSHRYQGQREFVIGLLTTTVRWTT